MEAIYAIDFKNGISKNGNIPWHSKEDLKFFMEKTTNNIVVMGRKTYFSIPERNRPLKCRLNIILSRKYEDFKDESVIVMNDSNFYEHILLSKRDYCDRYPFLKKDFTVFIIGGKEIYDQYVPICSVVWVTQIKRDCFCDLFLHYNYSEKYREQIIKECDELKIIKYTKIF